MTTIFKHKDANVKGEFQASAREIYDNKTKNRVAASAVLYVAARLRTIEAGDTVTVNGFVYRVVSLEPSDLPYYNRYWLVRVKRDENPY